ncbi:MAG: DUF21 domain-containing protein, partial [Butyrivibrio sp.]|nr:DUF21 domain-containing protein [Butyrivibrio sp.]
MDIHVIRIIILVVLVLLSAFFSSAETALMTCNKVRMKALFDEGNKRAGRVLDLTGDIQKV